MLAVVLAALQAFAPVPPSALHTAAGESIRLRTSEAYGTVGWDALQRTVTLHGAVKADGVTPERFFDHVVSVDFRPTAAAGMGLGRLAVAGRDGVRVCIELWRVEDGLEVSGPERGLATFAVVERRRVWEEIEADSIGLLLWNPMPPAGAQASLRALWHQRRELSRFDVDSAGWATQTLEAAMRGPTPRNVLQVPELQAPLAYVVQAEHAERGLTLLLQTPCTQAGWCCTHDDDEQVTLALLDRDRDGRLDLARRVRGSDEGTQDWLQLDTYVRILD